MCACLYVHVSQAIDSCTRIYACRLREQGRAKEGAEAAYILAFRAPLINVLQARIPLDHLLIVITGMVRDLGWPCSCALDISLQLTTIRLQAFKSTHP